MELAIVNYVIDALDGNVEDPYMQMAVLCMVFDHIVKKSGFSLSDATEYFIQAIKEVNAEFGDVGVI